MTNNAFSIDSLTVNPSYDFLKNLHSSNDNDYDYEDSPYNMNVFDCTYMDLGNYLNSYSNNPNITIMSVNIQSLSSKFSELNEIINALDLKNTSPDIICLQELWNIPFNHNFSIQGYNKLIYKIRSEGVQGGGIGFYVKCNLKCSVAQKYSIFIDRVIESLFINITLPNGKKSDWFNL